MAGTCKEGSLYYVKILNAACPRHRVRELPSRSAPQLWQLSDCDVVEVETLGIDGRDGDTWAELSSGGYVLASDGPSGHVFLVEGLPPGQAARKPARRAAPHRLPRYDGFQALELDLDKHGSHVRYDPFFAGSRGEIWASSFLQFL